jgi:hypothetical protein
MHDHPFVSLRRSLAQREGRALTDQKIAWLLGVQPKRVSDLQRAKPSSIRPAYLLALQLAIEVGIEACEEIDDPSKTEFDAMIRALPLTKEEIAMLLGLRGNALWALRHKAEVTIPRCHVLALHYLHRHLALPPALVSLRSWAVEYKARRKGTPRL